MPHLQPLSPELDGSHWSLASLRVVMRFSRVTGISSEVHFGVVCLNEPGFPVGPPRESGTVIILQAELPVSDQSGWEHGVLPDPEDFSWPKLVGSRSLI